jgi:hypothetical protein
MKMNVMAGRYYDMVLELLVLFAHEPLVVLVDKQPSLFGARKTPPCSIEAHNVV